MFVSLTYGKVLLQSQLYVNQVCHKLLACRCICDQKRDAEAFPLLIR